MSLVVSGTVSRINEREVNGASGSWMERTLVIEDWGQTQFVTASRELSNDLPAQGETVALVVAVRTYVGKDQSARFGLTGLRRHDELTKLLTGTTGPRAVAAS